MEYKKRFVDDTLRDRLAGAGAVLIEGAKGCGKTETAVQVAKSGARFATDEEIKLKLEIDPKSTLSGLAPRLVDEWQEYPGIWNYIRREVDDRKAKGQFILTGSANPEERVRLHSGAGRFSVFKMRPMSFYEKGWSTGEVSLADLMKGNAPASESTAFDLGKLTLGGWPGLIGANARAGLHFAQDYVALIAEADISWVSEKRRDPMKVRRLYASKIPETPFCRPVACRRRPWDICRQDALRFELFRAAVRIACDSRPSDLFGGS